MSDATSGWRAAERDADLRLELPGDGGPMHFQRIHTGAFRVGNRGFYPDEEPAHLVRIERPFYLGTFPVTERQLAASSAQSAPRASQRPATEVDWFTARRFCAWLDEHARGGPDGFTASLPSEVEWEVACRGGTTTEYWSGDGEAALAEVGWFAGNATSKQPVGDKPANPFGLYDMHGNVWEWCVDRWDAAAYRGRVDGDVYDSDAARSGAALEDSQTDRVVRGGAFNFSAGWCRAAYRNGRRPDDRNRYQGFRVCLFPGLGGKPASRAEASGARASDRRERREAERAGAPAGAVDSGEETLS